MRIRAALCLPLCLAACTGWPQSLAEMEARAKEKSQGFGQNLERERYLRAGVEKLIQSDSLKTPEDFRRAGILQTFANERKEPTMATSYQLLLTALALGDKEAAKSVGAAWDALLMATGRYRRIGSANITVRLEKGDQWWVDPAPDLVRNLYLKPDEAIKAAAGAMDNAEVKQIVDADQKVRQGDWSKLSTDQMMKIGQEDRARFHRIKVIIDEGGLKTAADFENAALVCQHGEVFGDYALAHELCVCAMILGSKTASWLAGASYDRMLMSASYPQAFATQYFWNWKLQEYTNVGVNDRMRTAVVHLTLAQAKDREKHPPK
ncbi:MAG TPA: hypothetical protein VG820_12635 [Fimbriimonadaceae bacterium]|nr:hypothetical protein [Fimbriimonadaceae bacterium]